MQSAAPIGFEDEDEKVVDVSYSQWSTSDNKIFVPTSRTVEKLIPGVYEIKSSPNVGTYFEKIPVKTEGLLRFPDTKSDRVVGEVQKFWDREDVFREYNISYKRGVILHGPPGSGKSCTVQLIMQDVVKRGGVVLEFQEPYIFIDGYRKLKEIQDTPTLVVMEDLDALLEMFNESEILNILDGANEVDKTVFLATTNYPHKLQPRIMNRPSRFDKRFRIGFPTAESREIYFNHLIGEENIGKLEIDLKKWVEDTDEMSLAHLKELFVAVVIIGDEYDEAIKTLSKMKEPVETKDFESHMGFGEPNLPPDYYD